MLRRRSTRLRRSTGFALLALSTAVGCAVGEIDDGPAFELGEFVRDTPVHGELFIEVVDVEGNPVQAEEVTIAVDGGASTKASCMEQAEGACMVWTAEFAALDRVTAWTSVCGHRFGAPMSFGPEIDEAQRMEAGVTIVAVRGLCTGSKPTVP